MFAVVKAGDYLSNYLSEHKTIMKKPLIDKHSSLPQKCVYYGCKKVCNINPWVRIRYIFFKMYLWKLLKKPGTNFIKFVT